MASKKETPKSSQSTLKKNTFVVRPPSDTSSKYFLIVTRGGSPFGGGTTAAFAVDYTVVQQDTAGKAVTIRGIRQLQPNGTEIVVEFPAGTSFLMVRRSDVDIQDRLEAAIEDYTEDKVLSEYFKDKKIDSPETSTLDAPGQYV